MTNSSQSEVESPDRGSFVQQLLTADIAILLGALIGLGVGWRGPNPGLARMAIAAGVGAVIGFLISRFLRRVSMRTRLLALVVILLVALPVLGAIMYGTL